MRTDPVQLLDELEGEIAKAKPVPLTDQVRLNGDRIRELLQELRAALGVDTGR